MVSFHHSPVEDISKLLQLCNAIPFARSLEEDRCNIRTPSQCRVYHAYIVHLRTPVKQDPHVIRPSLVYSPPQDSMTEMILDFQIGTPIHKELQYLCSFCNMGHAVQGSHSRSILSINFCTTIE